MKNTILSRVMKIVVVSIITCFLIFSMVVVYPHEENIDNVTELTTEIIIEEPDLHLVISGYLQHFDYVELDDKMIVIKQQNLLNQYINSLYKVLQQFDYRSKDYQIAYQILNPEIEQAKAVLELYNQNYKKIIEAEMIEKYWEEKAIEYPIATQVWRIMKEDFGWNDIVCAGFMGNFFAECGGCWTSDLDYQETSNGSVGLAQWLGSRRKSLYSIYGENPTVEEQMQFLYDEMHGTNGVNREITQKQYDAIMNAETPEECAYLFALYFERPNPVHIPPRKGYARRAYEYFTS